MAAPSPMGGMNSSLREIYIYIWIPIIIIILAILDMMNARIAFHRSIYRARNEEQKLIKNDKRRNCSLLVII